MALHEIPIQPTGKETRVTRSFQLESRQWTFRFYTNSVADQWQWDLINDATETLIAGETLALGVALLAKFRALDVPPGDLFVVEQGTGTGGRNPRQTSFADGVAALYYDDSA